MAGILLSKTDHERLKRMLRDYETNGKRPQYRRRAVSYNMAGGGACYIAKVDSDAAGGGYYNCHLQTLDATDWNTDAADQLDDTGDSVVVANMGEIGADVHALDAGDVLLCWQFTDDGGTARYIGMSPKYFWWHA